MSVAALPDVNGDGRTDLLIGAPGASRHCSPDEGAAFVVFTPPAPTPLDLDQLGASGYAISGLSPSAGAGSGVASAGDWNGDGRGDALVLRDPWGDDGPPRPPRLDLLLGRVPVPATAAGAPPSVAFPRPELRRVTGKRGLEAAVTLPQAAAGDTVLVELRTSAFGEDMPFAVGYTAVKAPGAHVLRVRTSRLFRDALRRRTRLSAQAVVSHCTAAGHEHAVTQPLELR